CSSCQVEARCNSELASRTPKTAPWAAKKLSRRRSSGVPAGAGARSPLPVSGRRTRAATPVSGRQRSSAPLTATSAAAASRAARGEGSDWARPARAPSSASRPRVQAACVVDHPMAPTLALPPELLRFQTRRPLPGRAVVVERRQTDLLAASGADAVLPESGVLEKDAERLERAEDEAVRAVEQAELEEV